MTEFHWNKPIFILGNPRSGTSLLRLMLDSHSSICIPPESHFFLWLEEKYGCWDIKLLESYLEDLFKSTKFETWNLEKDEVKNFLEDKTIDSYAKLNSLIYYYFSIKNLRNNKYWGDKNSLWTVKLNKIRMYYPNAFYIHIIRDGRDVGCSYKNLNSRKANSDYYPQLPNNIQEIATVWADNITHIENFLQSVDTEKMVQIRYEDLLKDPEKTLKRILNKLDLKFMKAQIQYYLKSKDEIEPEDFFAWKEKLKLPPDLSNIGKYKSILTNSEISSFNKIAGDILMKYNYL